jgi:N6-L-threonylcarbamoyladenine synthase
MTIIGETTDDAGEAFDKSAKYYLPYPGGPLIDKYAQLETKSLCFYKTKSSRIEFQFSGLKAILYFIQKKK